MPRKAIQSLKIFMERITGKKLSESMEMQEKYKVFLRVGMEQFVQI